VKMAERFNTAIPAAAALVVVDTLGIEAVTLPASGNVQRFDGVDYAIATPPHDGTFFLPLEPNVATILVAPGVRRFVPSTFDRMRADAQERQLAIFEWYADGLYRLTRNPPRRGRFVLAPAFWFLFPPFPAQLRIPICYCYWAIARNPHALLVVVTRGDPKRPPLHGYRIADAARRAMRPGGTVLLDCSPGMARFPARAHERHPTARWTAPMWCPVALRAAHGPPPPPVSVSGIDVASTPRIEDNFVFGALVVYAQMLCEATALLRGRPSRGVFITQERGGVPAFQDVLGSFLWLKGNAMPLVDLWVVTLDGFGDCPQKERALVVPQPPPRSLFWAAQYCVPRLLRAVPPTPACGRPVDNANGPMDLLKLREGAAENAFEEWAQEHGQTLERDENRHRTVRFLRTRTARSRTPARAVLRVPGTNEPAATGGNLLYPLFMPPWAAPGDPPLVENAVADMFLHTWAEEDRRLTLLALAGLGVLAPSVHIGGPWLQLTHHLAATVVQPELIAWGSSPELTTFTDADRVLNAVAWKIAMEWQQRAPTRAADGEAVNRLREFTRPNAVLGSHNTWRIAGHMAARTPVFPEEDTAKRVLRFAVMLLPRRVAPIDVAGALFGGYTPDTGILGVDQVNPVDNGAGVGGDGDGNDAANRSDTNGDGQSSSSDETSAGSGGENSGSSSDKTSGNSSDETSGSNSDETSGNSSDETSDSSSDENSGNETDETDAF
jgi:hypothetical protein